VAGKKLLGICVFRLPATDDPATLNVEQVAAGLNDQASNPAIYVRVKKQQQHVFVLEIKNAGTLSPIVGTLKVDLMVPAGSFESMAPQPGVRIQPLCAGGFANDPQRCGERRADLLRLTIDFLAPAQTHTATLLLNRDLPRTTGASVAMQTETEQAYSVKNEISVEGGVK
jgi:hypothetical protein